MTKQYSFQASVHKPLNDGFRVKAEEHNIGMFINGMVVFPPNEKHDDWKVMTPASKYGFRYVHYVEFNSKLPLWQELYIACVEAVKLYLANDNSEGSNSYVSASGDVVLTDIEDKPINLSEIPF